MALSIGTVVKKLAFYAFGAFMFLVYWGMSITPGGFFARESEKDKLELAIARDSIWNLSKPWEGLVHKFYLLQNGLRLHYVTNNPDQSAHFKSKPLVILIHGWPDSFSEWRSVIRSKFLQDECTIVAVDLPGSGGSDSFPPYTPDVVLDALTEFVLGIRELYDVDNDADNGHGHGHQSKVFICGHDWGCILSYRLAAEAPALADRFILTNGPHPSLVRANMERILSSATKMFRAFVTAPVVSRHCLPKAGRSLLPLIHQIYRIGYIFCFQFPPFMVRYLIYGGNRVFLRGIHELASSKHDPQFDQATYLANVLGPSPIETNTHTIESGPVKSQTYPASVALRAVQTNDPFETTNYYRNGLMTGPWEKSIETIAALQNLELSQGQLAARRHSSGALLFKERYQGALRAPVTIVWGQKDQVMRHDVVLDGIGDYLAKGSHVVLLPRSGHWTTIEAEGSRALRRVIEWAVAGEDAEKLESGVREMYAGASVSIRK